MTRRIRRLTDPGTLALTCVLLLAIGFVVQPQFDPDYWWHVLVGDRILHGSFPRTDPFTFTARGHAFIVQEWGSEALFAALARIGIWMVILVMAVVTGAGFLLALSRARRLTSSNAVLAVLAVIGLSLGRTVFGPRPQMFTFAFIAALLWVLDRHGRGGGRGVWLLVPMFALWGNLHGGFSLGLGIFAVAIAGDWAGAMIGDEGCVPPRRRRETIMVFIASVAALVVNPNGIAVYRYAAGLISNSVAQSNLDEWRSPNFHDHDFLPLAVLVALIIVIAPRARRITVTDALLAGAGVILTLYAVRNLSTMIVTSMPLLADGLESWREMVVEWYGKRRPLRSSTSPTTTLAMPFCAIVLTLVALVTLVFTSRSFVDPLNNDRSAGYPTGVADALCAGPPVNVLEPYGRAGWLLYEIDHGAPRPCARDPVFIFGEVYVIGPAIFQDYLDAVDAAPDTEGILNAHHVDAVWQSTETSLAKWLRGRQDWTCVWTGGHDIVYARTAAASAWRAGGAGCAARAAR